MLKYACALSLFILFSFYALSAKPLYVSAAAAAGGDGSLNRPYATLQKAADVTQPGDTVYVMNGTYSNGGTDNVVLLSHSGTASQWIVFIAYLNHKPRLSFTGWGGFRSQSAAYIEINGFEIVGNRDNLTLDFAKSHGGTAETGGSGIEFDGRGQQNHPHHIRILNNSIFKCPGAGISMIQSDYITVDNNKIWGNAWYSQWAHSGCTIYQSWGIDTNTTTKIFVTRNLVYDNRSLVNWVVTSALSDGNGIIFDDSKHTQNGSTHGVYAGRTLIANNISFNNGGAGIHSFSSAHVDIVNNTGYYNGQVVNYANIYAVDSKDVRVLNNVMVSAPGKPLTWNSGDTNVTYDYNVYYGDQQPIVMGPHDIKENPLFVNASIDPLVANFHISQGSPAIDKGTSALTLVSDYEGRPRPQNGLMDIGAYEYTAASLVRMPHANFGSTRREEAGAQDAFRFSHGKSQVLFFENGMWFNLIGNLNATFKSP